MSIEVLDPGYEEEYAAFELAPRIVSLTGATIGLISNGKEGTQRFFDALERELIESHGVETVVRTTKGNYSAPAESVIMTQSQDWHAAIAGVGD